MWARFLNKQATPLLAEDKKSQTTFYRDLLQRKVVSLEGDVDKLKDALKDKPELVKRLEVVEEQRDKLLKDLKVKTGALKYWKDVAMSSREEVKYAAKMGLAEARVKVKMANIAAKAKVKAEKAAAKEAEKQAKKQKRVEKKEEEKKAKQARKD